MRIEAIEISQHEGDTLYFRTEHPETGEDRVAQLCEAIENGTEFTAEDLLGRIQTIHPDNIETWEKRRVEDTAL
ncbi:hypothetical protein M3D57_10945 [Corynebacterium sanguinis]|uniref:hypothetical protein n=1 Tax=Corynebacterium sanguinis TaxID=2594913 RepID=UPI0011855BBF|nr:hypothetical protein [Corynebacterium sanguinis]MCT1554759.1 hypothetical protein [Corynebacterium sanguinis]MCT1585774.1 hypothetical protein [Corynebacterium sanguinis]MCT1805240.1 hypothetical protein [Corynebacterium sanguinis]MCT2024021.1 hypothetical protein [Corynebacterium sanguinis]MCT2048001.1 hypothetical protein [Corynebacterium sanguinis]